MIGIYKITNPNNEIYIGQSTDIDKRIYSHKMSCSNIGLKKSIDFFGFDNHKIDIICECDAFELRLKEAELILEYIKKSFVLFNSDYYGQSSGRKKVNTVKVTVSLHPSLIKEVRNYAKQRTIEELKKEEKL